METVGPDTGVVTPEDGISFWMHAGPEIGLIGTWLGLTYHVPDRDSLAELAAGCFASCAPGTPPYRQGNRI
jgi:hypothetical protein